MNQKNLPSELKSGNILGSFGQYRLRPEEVKYEPCLFAYLDILGYKELLQTLGACAPSYFYEILRNTFEDHRSLYESVEVKLLSDSILVWSKGRSAVHFWNVVNITDLIRQAFLKKKLFLRGGIAEGLNFIDQDIIISPALINAYQLEQQAKMPRIIISDAAIALATEGVVRDAIGQSYIQVAGYARRIHLDQIVKDFDGKEVLRSFSESNGTYFIRTGLPFWFTPSDTPVTEEQKVSLRTEGKSDLETTRNLLLDMRPTKDNDPEILIKYSYVIGKFNEWMALLGDDGRSLVIES